jgi:hypothetical protein
MAWSPSILIAQIWVDSRMKHCLYQEDFLEEHFCVDFGRYCSLLADDSGSTSAVGLIW